jgi:hypothetical protein
VSDDVAEKSELNCYLDIVPINKTSDGGVDLKVSAAAKLVGGEPVKENESRIKRSFFVI